MIKPPSNRHLSERERKSLARELAESFVVAVVIALLIRHFVLGAYRVPTASMAPTLKVGDFVFAYRVPYGVNLPLSTRKFGLRPPKRGEVVVFRFPGNESVSFVKRVVGLPGDVIAIRNRKLFINNQPASYEPADTRLIADQQGHEYYQVWHEEIEGRKHLVLMSEVEPSSSFGPQTVPAGKFFVLGDNRDSSDDSRFWGAIPFENIEGRIVCVWLSLDWQRKEGAGSLPRVRWDRLLLAIH